MVQEREREHDLILEKILVRLLIDRTRDDVLVDRLRELRDSPAHRASASLAEGSYLLRAGREHSAIEPLELAVARDPGSADAWLALAVARHRTGDVEGGRGAAARAVREAGKRRMAMSPDPRPGGELDLARLPDEPRE